MSLVAYDASSDEESDGSAEEVITKVEIKKTEPKLSEKDLRELEDQWEDTKVETNGLEPSKSLKLPAPSKPETYSDSDEDVKEEVKVPKFDKLPAPKPIQPPKVTEVLEADDEFLHKKAVPPKDIEKPSRNPVKITIPSLSEFKDLDDSTSKKGPVRSSVKKSGLLNMLPKPKHEAAFSKSNSNGSTDGPSTVTKTTSLVPDSVKNAQMKMRAKEANAKFLQNHLKQPNKPNKKKEKVIKPKSDSEDSGNENEDFFSLNSGKDELPAVSENEIQVMVAKRAAQMAHASSRIDAMLKPETSQDEMNEYETQGPVQTADVGVDDKAIQALVGSRAKRAKMENINIVELSAAEVLPDKDEWLRTALASATEYQPKGVLVDEEPAPGTRKKHQITYLAHQAKANEQELQAMWSANRHTRRQTQSKYGF